MNRKLPIVLSVLIIGAFGQPAFAKEWTINFTGTIVGATCAVSINKGGNGSGTNPAAIVLPKVSTTALATAGDKAGRTFLTFDLTSCGTGLAKASAYFNAGPNITSADGRLVNTSTATDKATKVELEILNLDGVAMDLSLGAGASGQSKGQKKDITNNTASLRYYVQYYATGAATAGPVASSVDYEINYE